MEAKFEELIEGFVTGNIGISETFLSVPLAAALLQNLHQLNEEGLMIRAGIGNTHTKETNGKIRSDSTCWLKADTKNDAELEFLGIIAQFTEHLNRTCYTGLNACEFHYALYDKGAFYARHKDRFRTNDNRKFFLISYLNTDWLETDGGHLIIYNNETTRSIAPNNQKAIFFQSDILEHEVAIAHRPRMSVTGWLKRV